jgi:signal transduction histidine kinase
MPPQPARPDLRNSLIFRVIGMNILLLTVGIGVFTVFHYQRDRQNMLAVTTDGAEILMATIENAVFNSKCRGDAQKLQNTLEFIARSPSLRGVRIFNPHSGRIANSSRPDEIDQVVAADALALYRSGRSSALFQHDNEEVLSIVRPITSRSLCQDCHGTQEQVLGVLNLNYSMQSTAVRLAQSSRCFSLSMVFITLLLSAGVSFILLRYVRRPIQALTHRMAQVEAGEKNVRMVPKSTDEIGYLMRSFNSMVGRLEATQTELEQYHFRQMEQADRLAAIGEMATGMAHEIKNPLAGISGAVTVLADDLPVGDPRRQVVADILGQIDRLNKTATDLLHFGRPGQPQCSYVQLNEVVCETLFFVAQHPEACNVRQDLALQPDLPPIWADRKQIQQVVLNIIINALQAMPDGGSLRLTSELKCEQDQRCYVRLIITDTGVGLDVTQLERIFTPFYTTKTRGTGLGLAICRQLVKQNDGRISLVSAPGEGTSFTLSFPAAAPPEPAKEEEPA